MKLRFVLPLVLAFALGCDLAQANPIAYPTPMPFATTLYLNGPPSIVAPSPNSNPYDYKPGDQFSATKFDNNWWAPWRFLQETVLPALNGCNYVPGAVPSTYTVQLPMTVTETGCSPGVGTTLSLGWSATTPIANPIATLGTVQAAGITSTAGIAAGGALTGATTGAFSGVVAANGINTGTVQVPGSGNTGNLILNVATSSANGVLVNYGNSASGVFAVYDGGYSNRSIITGATGGQNTLNGPLAVGGALTASSVTATGLTVGNCVQVTTGGLFTTAADACGTAQNFVDRTTAQTVAGAKTFTSATGFGLNGAPTCTGQGASYFTWNQTGGGAESAFTTCYNATVSASFWHYNGTSTVQSSRINADGTYISGPGSAAATGTSAYGPSSASVSGPLSSQQTAGGASGYVPPVYNSDGTATASTMHGAIGGTGVIPPGSSRTYSSGQTYTFNFPVTGPAAFSTSAFVFASINDTRSYGNWVITNAFYTSGTVTIIIYCAVSYTTTFSPGISFLAVGT